MTIKSDHQIVHNSRTIVHTRDSIVHIPNFADILEPALAKMSPESEVRLFFTILADEEGKKDPTVRDAAESAARFYKTILDIRNSTKAAGNLKTIEADPADTLEANMEMFTPAQQRAFKVIMRENEPDALRKKIKMNRLIGRSISAAAFVTSCIIGTLAIGNYREMSRLQEQQTSAQVDTPPPTIQPDTQDTNNRTKDPAYRAKINVQNDASVAAIMAMAGICTLLYTSKFCKLDEDYMGLGGAIDCALLLETTNQFLGQVCTAYNEQKRSTARA